MKTFLPCLTILFCQTTLMAQTVTNVIARAEGEQIHIVYDLGGNVGESYEVKLSCSRDGGKTFAVTPSKVMGAVNRWEAPGSAKSITWDAKKDLGEFEGNLQFKVVATGKGGAVSAVPKTSVPTTSPSANTGSLVSENDNMQFTITSVFTVTDGFKVFFKIKAKRELEVGFNSSTQAEDQFGNVYTIASSDIESIGVLGGKTRKFMANSRKDGEMILKVSKMNSSSLNGRVLKNLFVDSTVGSLQLTDIPRL